MVADFVDEYDGYLALTQDEQAKNPTIAKSTRALFECGADKGYWTGEKFMAQTKNACDIAEAKYPLNKNTIVFIFDQKQLPHQVRRLWRTPGKNILVKDGGPWRVLDTVWAGSVVHRRWCFQTAKPKA